VLGVILHASSGYNGGRHEEHCSLDFGSFGYGFGCVRRRQAGGGPDLDDGRRNADRHVGGPGSTDGHVGSPGSSGDPGSPGDEVISC
jgi:hypothetical protein